MLFVFLTGKAMILLVSEFLLCICGDTAVNGEMQFITLQKIAMFSNSFMG